MKFEEPKNFWTLIHTSLTLIFHGGTLKNTVYPCDMNLWGLLLNIPLLYTLLLLDKYSYQEYIGIPKCE